MRIVQCFLCVLLLLTSALQAELIIHLQSPYRNDASKADYYPHILGSVTSYNPMYGNSSNTLMKKEESNWFSYVWNKSVGDFQSWETFSIKFCPNTADQNYNNNNCESWESGGDALSFSIVSFFGSDTEVWLYTNTADGSYEKSFVAPGSKIVWFKSPWGNRALPQMIFGRDSILMRFAVDDESMCGWFYGAISPTALRENPAGSVHFIRYQTPYFSLPEKGSLDLSASLSSSDTVFVDGLSDLKVTKSISSKGACFDSTRTLHIYHPWRTNTSYRDSAVYISVGNNILNNPTATDSSGEYRYWWHYDFSPSVVAKGEWNSSGAKLQFYRRQNEWPQVTYFSDESRPEIASLFPRGIYEVWIFTRGNGAIDVSFSPLEQKVVRLMSPWDNMTPSMLVNGDTVKMGPFSNDTCGWYQAAYYKHVDSWEVSFKQTFGFENYASGGIDAGDWIVLDSVLSVLDTVWVMPYPTLSSAPKIYDMYPGRLGTCPTMKISAMVVDWAGESYADNIDVDFGGIYGGNAYTTVEFGGNEYKTCQGHVKGMVRDTLVNGLPARVDSLLYPWGECSAAHEIERWFVPEVVARASDGTEYTNAVCRDIDLMLDEEGFWLADITEAGNCNDPVNPGFYPIDDFEYLDSAKTIKNPKFDWDVQGCKHNYSFAMKISAQFQYIKGQYFEFRGDDDVWVFINNRLVVDIGGCHSPVEGGVDLDTLGLIEGKEYPFHIFFSERNATGSNFKMRTSINLQTQKTYYKEEEKTADGTIMYSLKQMLVDESLSCDVSSVSKVEIKDAPSIFMLFGGNLPAEGRVLGPGEEIRGILINEYMSGFVIDTAKIVASRSLAPGNYVLLFALESDPSQIDQVSFMVPEYPLPTIAFADSLGEIIDPDTVSLGQYAFVLYPVRVKVLYYGEVCNDCIIPLSLSTKDSLLFYDENSMPIDTVWTDSTGFALFYVMGLETIENGSFTVSSIQAENELVWKKIYLEKPPVPIPLVAEMHDRNGDGVGDSLFLSYSDLLIGSDYSLDTVGYVFGDSSWKYFAPHSKLEKYISDSSFTIESDSLVKFRFTGAAGSIYYGNSKSHFTYTDSTGEQVPFPLLFPIADKIPPVLVRAIVVPKNDKASLLSLYFSESLEESSKNDSALFDFRVWSEGVEVGKNLRASSKTFSSDGSRVDILFTVRNASDALPSVGDSVRFKPGHALDLSGNLAHKNNPWVRIEGEQRLRIEHTKVFAQKNMPEKDSVSIRMHAVSMEKSFDEIQKEVGRPGFLIRFDLGELLLGEESLSPKDIVLSWEENIFTNLGNFVNANKGKISCADALFDGDCRQSPKLIYISWDMRANSGRLVGSGAFVSKANVSVKKGKSTVAKKNLAKTFGIRRTGK